MRDQTSISEEQCINASILPTSWPSLASCSWKLLVDVYKVDMPVVRTHTINAFIELNKLTIFAPNVIDK